MGEDQIPPGLLISAKIRTAARENIPIVVRRRGHETLGTIFLKINLLDGTSHLLSQVRSGDDILWYPMSKTDPLPERDAEELLAKQGTYDPDCWIVEIEDKEGRLWFPGALGGIDEATGL